MKVFKVITVFKQNTKDYQYRSGTVNSKFYRLIKIFLLINRKFELNNNLLLNFNPKLRIRSYFELD